MRKSLIESIGRETALKLMSDAVLQAIEERKSAYVFCKDKTSQGMDAPRCIVEADCQVPMVAVPPQASRLLNKQVPIA